MTPSRHAVIAGTGRAGTSFLVQFLQACGLETSNGSDVWFDRARAGLEAHLQTGEDLPYVVKDPWLFSYCHDLDLARIQIDALIVPVRDLMSAAESRIHQERIALTETWLSGQDDLQVAGITPGGAVYSLDVVDQSRLLAVGFHNLLHWAAIHELPVYLPAFPRMVEDADYLIRVLRPWLREHCTDEVAREAFASTAAAKSVRIQPRPPDAGQGLALGPAEPDRQELDRAALWERVRELSARENGLTQQLEATRAQRDAEALRAHELRAELVMAQQQIEGVQASFTWRSRQWLVSHRLLHRVLRLLIRPFAR